MHKHGYSTCMNPSVMVWDLETAPDIGGFAVAHDPAGKLDVEVRIGERFPQHMYRQLSAREVSLRIESGISVHRRHGCASQREDREATNFIFHGARRSNGL